MILDLEPTEPQVMLAASVAGLLGRALKLTRLRDPALHGARAELAIWPQIGELGLFGLGLHEDEGGLGLGAAEEALAARGFGRVLASPALLAQMAAPYLAADAASRAALIAGQQRACLAWLDRGQTILLDQAGAENVVLLAPGAAALLPAASFRRQPAEGIDDTLGWAVADGVAAPPRTAVAARISLLIAAYLTGVAQAACDMAVEYAGTRRQFGQPIGAFQAVKHACADMAVRAAAAEAQLFYAAARFGADGADEAEVAAARLLATDAALANARANIQVHGAMGFTAESDAHWLLKRAHVLAYFGSGRRHMECTLLTAGTGGQSVRV